VSHIVGMAMMMT